MNFIRNRNKSFFLIVWKRFCDKYFRDLEKDIVGKYIDELKFYKFYF